MSTFAPKLVWLISCLFGTGMSCLVLQFFPGRECGWIPASYATALVVYTLSILAGLVWNLDPGSMPESFCVGQIAVLSLSRSILVGMLTIHSTIIRRSKLWRKGHTVILIVLPLLSTVLQIGLAAKFDAFGPQTVGGTFCDVNDPRLNVATVGGLYLLECFLALCYFAVIAFRLHKMQRTTGDTASMELETEIQATRIPKEFFDNPGNSGILLIPNIVAPHVTPPRIANVPAGFLARMWRTLLFHVLLVVIVVLFNLSDLISLATGQPAHPVIKEIASAFACWTPALIFGSQTTVRDALMAIVKFSPVHGDVSHLHPSAHEINRFHFTASKIRKTVILQNRLRISK
ncbi:hypothetical protein FIBSPDRAFT_62913 [Athelia psychrophila]|uniref:Glucose receptor Git3 N-terminal domain-containing protein n=1 Tax=Athelia psychrophila TaxID=1759441 RepID=A0A166F2W5_9AGAM|nr:hypothetical protein FIBSPDRAFT_62913 [Fibularhizoctonia sp. CBS 109695]